MPQPHVLVLRAPGTNCDLETAFAFETAGAATERVHVNRVLEQPALFDRFQILCIPGGFSYGDDVAAGRILANQLEHHLGDAITRFKDAGKLILGICNGFQVLIKLGVLLGDENGGGPAATLTWNDSGRYEDRWARLGVDGAKCVFLRDIDEMYLPVAHAEGKFVARDEATLGQLAAAGQLPLRYLPLQASGGATDVPGNVGRAMAAHSPERPSSHPTTLPFPDNPNGSQANVAGVCDPTGRVLGLMPHPERHITHTQHPRWTRPETTKTGDGLKMFQNAVAYFA
jgi:phosphoribosylformylglycinamidine synthase subunit PurQ / glutaminase